MHGFVNVVAFIKYTFLSYTVSFYKIHCPSTSVDLNLEIIRNNKIFSFQGYKYKFKEN